jgi:hypothetical protein
MAARQDQTLQIFLIIFIFAFLVSAVAAYLGWKNYSEANQRAADAQKQLSDANAQVQTQRTIIEEHQVRMGFGPSDNAPDVQKAFEDDMKAYGGGVADEASRSYRKVLEAVYHEGQATAAREAKVKEELKETTARLEGVEAAADAQVAKIQQANKELEARAAEEKNTFNIDRKKMAKSQEELMAKVESQKVEFDATLAKKDADNAKLQETVGKLEHAVQNLIENRKDEPGSFEIADGRVSWVNQNGTVWINLGTADSLRRQVTFSVYDSDQHDAAKATKKGSIEVTRLMGEHMAEARITEDDPTNPILTGDHVYSQVWHRGKKLHFALTGIVDLDGNGQSDMDLARHLIELNGGVVDAYLSDEGVVEGEITANTRYLVLGDVPTLATQVKLNTGYHEMSKAASSLGVEKINIVEFLSQMGYKPQDRTVPLGAAATAHDFPARPEDSSIPVTVPRFRVRRP